MLRESYNIRREKLDEMENKLRYELKASEFEQLTPLNEPNWKTKLLDAFIKVDDPEEIKAIGKTVNALQTLQLLQFAIGNDYVANRLIYFIGSLRFEVLQESMESFRFEDRSRLIQLNEILKRPVYLIKGEEIGCMKIFDSPLEDVEGRPDTINVTEEVHKWFNENFKETRQLLIDINNSQKQKIDGYAKRFRTGILKRHEIKLIYMTDIATLENVIMQSWQVILNYHVLVKDVIKDEKTFSDLDTEYAIFRGRFDKHDPRGKAAADQLDRVALQEDIRLVMELFAQLMGKLKKEQILDTEGNSLLMSINERCAKIKNILGNNSEVGGGIFDVIEYDAMLDDNKQDDDDFEFLFPDEKVKAMKSLYRFCVFNDIDLVKEAGLLQNVSETEFVKARHTQLNKLFEYAKTNLVRVGIITKNDLRRLRIYNAELLKAHMSKPEVKDLLAKYNFAIDPFGSLQIWGLHTLEEYKEIGIFQNIPDYLLEKLSKQNPEILFKHAKANLQYLGIQTASDWTESKGVKDKSGLKSYFERPEVREKLMRHSLKVDNPLS